MTPAQIVILADEGRTMQQEAERAESERRPG